MYSFFVSSVRTCERCTFSFLSVVSSIERHQNKNKNNHITSKCQLFSPSGHFSSSLAQYEQNYFDIACHRVQ